MNYIDLSIELSEGLISAMNKYIKILWGIFLLNFILLFLNITQLYLSDFLKISNAIGIGVSGTTLMWLFIQLLEFKRDLKKEKSKLINSEMIKDMQISHTENFLNIINKEASNEKT